MYLNPIQSNTIPYYVASQFYNVGHRARWGIWLWGYNVIGLQYRGSQWNICNVFFSRDKWKLSNLWYYLLFLILNTVINFLKSPRLSTFFLGGGGFTAQYMYIIMLKYYVVFVPPKLSIFFHKLRILNFLLFTNRF